MRVTPVNNADWYGLKTPIFLREMFRIQNPHQVEHCAFLVFIHVLQQVGCARNKHQFLTVQQNLKSILGMQDWDWTVFLLLIMGSGCFQFLEARLRNTIERRDPLFAITRFTECSTWSERSQGKTNELNNVDFVPSNVQFLHQAALLYVFEDNEAVINELI